MWSLFSNCISRLHTYIHTFYNPIQERKKNTYKYNLHELRNLQSSDSSSQFPNLAPQTLRIAKEINKHPPLEPNSLRMMFNNLVPQN